MGVGASFLFGVAAGLVLGFGRAPLGLDWVRLAAVDGATAAAARAAALAAVALMAAAAGGRRVAFRPLALAGGLAAGFALQSLVLDGPLAVETRTGLAVAIAVPAVLGALVARARPSRTSADDPGGAVPRLAVGHLVAAAGAAIALETLARPVRSLGLGLAADDAIFGTAFLVLAVIGALAFGPLVASGDGRRQARELGALAVVLGAWIGWWFLSRFDQPNGLAAHMRLVGLGPLFIGTWRWDAAVAVPAFVLAAFALGAWVFALGQMRRLAAVALGGALGTLAVAWLRDGTAAILDAQRIRDGAGAEFGLVVGALVAAAGAAITAVGEARRGEPGRRKLPATALVAIAVAVVVLAVRPRPLVLLSPWMDVPVEPVWALETADGRFTVEATRFGERVATLDRRLLEPLGEAAATDVRDIGAALGALDLFALPSEAPRVLFIGLLTPRRSAAFASRPGIVLERTAPWYPWDGLLEEALAEGAPLVGTRIAPAEARRRIASGSYQLVVAAPAGGVMLAPRGMFDQSLGPPPRAATAALEAPAGTAGIAWFDAASDVALGSLSPVALLGGEVLERPFVARLAGEALHWPDRAVAGRQAALPVGPRPRGVLPIARLRLHARDRADAARRTLARRLVAVQATQGAEGPYTALVSALYLHAEAQRLSAMWASRAEAIELDRESVGLFASAAAETRGDPFVDRVFEDVADLLLSKQLYEEIIEHVTPVADARAPWVGLERVLIEAYHALLAPEAALERIVRLLERRPGDPELWISRGESERALGLDGARASFERADELGPWTYDGRRRLAVGLVETGSPRGVELVRELLDENPFDNALRDYLEPRERPDAPR